MTNSKKPNDSQAMTVGHGRQLYGQTKEIAEQILHLKQLLEQSEAQPGPDPIDQITALLQNLALQNAHQLSEMQVLNSKLDAVLSALGVAEL